MHRILNNMKSRADYQLHYYPEWHGFELAMRRW